MKRIAIVALGLLSIAATYTINTTAGQENRITRLRTHLAAQGISYADNNALVLDVCGGAIVSRLNDVEDAEALALAARARQASQAQRDSACTSLGGTVVGGKCQ